MFQLGVAILVLLHVCSSVAYDQVQSEDLLVCKPIGLFEMQQSKRNSTPLRGPREFPGIQGPPGPAGPLAVVDWNRVERIIEMKIKEMAQCPGVVYNGSCFWLPQRVASTKGKGKAAAESLCEFFNGTLVDIENEAMYNKLYSYIQRAWDVYLEEPSSSFVQVWLASNNMNGQIKKMDGALSYTRWFPTYPLGSEHGMAWSIATNPLRGSRIGMFNIHLGYEWAVPLCRIPLTT